MKRRRSSPRLHARTPSPAPVNEQCPLTMESIHKLSSAFKHHNIVLDAKALHDYLVATPDATNPLNRQPFTDDERNVLNAMFPNEPAILVGKDADDASKDMRERESALTFLEDEAKTALRDFQTSWMRPVRSGSRIIFCMNLFHATTASLLSIKADVLSMRDGDSEWDKISSSMEEFVETIAVDDECRQEMFSVLDVIDGQSSEYEPPDAHAMQGLDQLLNMLHRATPPIPVPMYEAAARPVVHFTNGADLLAVLYPRAPSRSPSPRAPSPEID